MATFKVGDRVKCVNGLGSMPKMGETYTVKWAGDGSRPNMIGIDYEEPEWWAERFVLVPEQEPQGVRTVEEVRADRRKELLDGIVRFHSAGKEVPNDWIAELVYRN